MSEELPAKFTKKDTELLEALVQGVGFGLAPSGKIHGITPKPGGEVAVFAEGHGVDFSPSEEFNILNTVLLLGAMVSQSDDGLATSEQEMLTELIENNRKLKQVEKDSLHAFLFWSLKTPQGMAGLKKRLSKASEKEKIAISRVLITVALADGRIDPGEVKLLKKIYPILGLDEKRVESDLHNLVTSSDPVTVELKGKQKGFKIPDGSQEPDQGDNFQLNMSLIESRKKETKEVKAVLEGIFTDQEEETFELTPEDSSESKDPLASLDKEHRNIFNTIITKESWDRSDIQEICKENGLMFDGAMEIINEWAYDFGNAPLIDDGEPIYVDVNLAREITNVEQS